MDLMVSVITMEIKQVEKLIEVERFEVSLSVPHFKYASDLERIARGMPNQYTRTDMSQEMANKIHNRLY